MNINEIKELTTADMMAVDELIKKRLYSEVVLVNQVSQYIVNSGGKRLRPLLALLSAQAYGYQGEGHFALAAIIEFIHTATLLHDDVVDESELRRGSETANALFGNAASVLVGDFLYSRSFQMMVELDNFKIMAILSESTNIIAEGEVLQLMNCHDADTTEARYIEVIHFKTAKLFEAATRLGAVICERADAEEQAMASYGMHLGTAFQLIDDVLDYSSSSDEMGKNVGDDLAEGKPTLPLIYAMRNGNDAEKALVRKAIEEGGLDYIDEVMAIIKKTGAIEYTKQAAEQEAKLAIEQLSHLPSSRYKEALISLAEYSVNRSF
ncbi:MAG: octaprenyl diphosphate synthase [Gammaproteobacteria bacterium]|nr:octaprenyl diphosphate synthase [Gammaproteobacteria bacterium]